MKLHLDKNFIFCIVMAWVAVPLYANDLDSQKQFIHNQAAVKLRAHYSQTPPQASHSKSTKLSSYKVWAGVAMVGLTAAAAVLYGMSRNDAQALSHNPVRTGSELVVWQSPKVVFTGEFKGAYGQVTRGSIQNISEEKTVPNLFSLLEPLFLNLRGIEEKGKSWEMIVYQPPTVTQYITPRQTPEPLLGKILTSATPHVEEVVNAKVAECPVMTGSELVVWQSPKVVFTGEFKGAYGQVTRGSIQNISEAKTVPNLFSLLEPLFLNLRGIEEKGKSWEMIVYQPPTVTQYITPRIIHNDDDDNPWAHADIPAEPQISARESYFSLFNPDLKPWVLKPLTDERRECWRKLLKELDEIKRGINPNEELIAQLEQRVYQQMQCYSALKPEVSGPPTDIIKKVKEKIPTGARKIWTMFGIGEDKNLTNQFVGQISLRFVLDQFGRKSICYLTEENVVALFGLEGKALNFSDVYKCLKAGSFYGIAAIETTIIHELGEKLDPQSLATLGRFCNLVHKVLCAESDFYIDTPIHTLLRYGHISWSEKFINKDHDKYIKFPGYLAAYEKVVKIMHHVPGYDAATENGRVNHMLLG